MDSGWLFVDASYSGNAVEIRIEAHNPLNSVALHYSDMEGIASRHLPFAQYQVAGPLNVCTFDRVNSFDDRQQCFKCRLNVLAPIDGSISVKNVLENLGVGDQWSLFGYKSFEKPVGI